MEQVRARHPHKQWSNSSDFCGLMPHCHFDDKAAIEYGQIRAYLERQGTPVGPIDTLIAAIALANNLILVTHNTAEFSRVPGLKIEDWET